MAKDEFVDAIVQTIHSESNNNPPPTMCTVSKVYTDGEHIDVKLWNGDKLEYVKCIGTPVVDKDAVVLFCDGRLDTPIVIV
jgi:hypothetical protein